MAEYEPDDSRVVTRTPSQTPGEPPRTGPREQATRTPAAGPGDPAPEATGTEPRGEDARERWQAREAPARDDRDD